MNDPLPEILNGLSSVAEMNEILVECRRCPRLVAWREETARTKRRAFMDWEYWGRPIPGFGDPEARLLIVGLAPAAHGGNRTGRSFTGDFLAIFYMRPCSAPGLPTSLLLFIVRMD